MSTPMDPYPGSQSLELAPILQAVFADIQSRNIKIGSFAPQRTPYPPPDTDPGLAFNLAVTDRLAYMSLHRYGVDATLETYYCTGGGAFGPKRIEGVMVFPSQWIDLLSLLTVTWITLKLNELNLVPWSMKKVVSYYPTVVANPLYQNVLRTFCHNVLGFAEDSFTSTTDNHGYVPDVVDE